MRIRVTALAVIAPLALTACGSESGARSAAPVTVTATPPPTTAPSAAAAPTAPTPVASKAPAAGGTIRLPNLAGHNHQEAQDDLQALGLYMLEEKDATGQGRMLLLDRNWVVVRQSPKAGTKVTTNTVITLYSKKIGE